MAIRKRKNEYKLKQNHKFIKDLETHGDKVALLMKEERRMAKRIMKADVKNKHEMLGVLSNDNNVVKDKRFDKTYKGYWKQRVRDQEMFLAKKIANNGFRESSSGESSSSDDDKGTDKKK